MVADVSGHPRTPSTHSNVSAGSRLDYALRYAQKGMHVIPLHRINDEGQCTCGNLQCKSPGKHPLTFRGVKDATTNEAQLRDWFSRWPDANIGVATGQVSGFFAVDIDPRNGGDVTWQDLVDEHGAPEIGVEALTGGGGFHYLFSYPAQGVKSAKWPGGIDIKSDGGYIVVEPSNHASGISYAWEGSSDPLDDAEFTQASSWILTKQQSPDNNNDLPAPEQSAQQFTEIKVRELRSAMAVIPADDRDVWLQVGMALHSEVPGQQAYGLWCEWSQNCAEKFDPVDSARVWQSFKGGDGITLSTLFRLAKNYGWQDLTIDVPSSPGEPAVPDEPLEFLPASTWYGQPVPERQWLLPDWIPMSQTTALYGDGGVGKTLVAQQLATCIVTGKPFFHMKEFRQGKVLGVFCEDSFDELHMRQDAINKSLGIDWKDLADLKLASRVGFDNLLMTFDGHDAGSVTAFWYQIVRAVEQEKPALVIVDTAADTFGGNENIRSQVRQYIQGALTRIAVDNECAILLCAHPSAAGLSSGSGTGGSTAWSNTVRSRLYLHRDEELGCITLERKKSNYAAVGEQINMVWNDGAFIDAVAVPGEIGISMEAGLVEKDFVTLLTMLVGRQQNVSASKNGNYAPKVFADMGKQHGMHAWTQVQYEGAMERLFGRGVIQTAKGFGNTRGQRIALKDEG